MAQSRKHSMFDVEEYYNKIYDKKVDITELKIIKRNLPFKNVRQDIIKKFINKNKKNGILLSIGCGIGENEDLFSKEDYKLFGTDISFNALSIARKYCKKCTYFQARAEFLPIKNNCVDIILVIDVIEHVFNDELILNEVSRVLKKDGILVLTTNFSGKYEDVAHQSINLSIDSLGEGGDLRAYGLNLIDRLRERELELVELKFAGGLLSKQLNKIKDYFLQSHSRIDIISGKVIKGNPNYLFYSKVLKVFYKLDFLIFGRIKGNLIFLGCRKKPK